MARFLSVGVLLAVPFLHGCFRPGRETSANVGAEPVATPDSIVASTVRVRQGDGGPDLIVRAPQTVAGLDFVRRRDYPHDSLGVQLRYWHRDTLQLDLFVYPGPDLGTRCPIDCARRALDDEIAGSLGELRELTRLRQYERFDVTSDESLSPPPASAWQLGRHLVLAVRITGLAHDLYSDYYLFYLPGYRVKVRATYRQTPERRERVEAFVREILPTLAARTTRAG